MTQYLLIGDPHAKPSNLEILNQLFQMVEAQGLPTIWLGDLLDTKEMIRGSCLNAYWRYFRDSRLHHYVIVGNHDFFNLECKEHSLETLKALPNVTIADSPLSHDGMLFLPYLPGGERVRTALWNCKSAVAKDNPILIAHLEVSGFDLGTGQTCEDGLSLDDLRDFELVISGHFHKHQKMGNLVYLGTPFSHSFGESNQEKVIAILDAKTKSLEYIPTPFPRHLTHEWDCDAEEAPNRTLDQRHYNRVILTGRSENIAKIAKDSFPQVKFVERPDETIEGELSIVETVSNEEKFITWAEGKKLSKETLKLGLEIMKDVGR